MEAVGVGTWAGLLALGGFHGVNPAMGWLFAVARGMQEGRRAEVWRALLPLGLGHALAVGALVLAAAAVGRALPLTALRWVVAAALVALGIRHLVRHRHPRSRGMRVGMGGITVWSFLMASAHGAGLMVLPFLLGGTGPAVPAGHGPATAATVAAGPVTGLALTAVHAVGYLVVSGVVAAIVYEKVGLRCLRSGWINLDLVWALALVATGAGTLLV